MKSGNIICIMFVMMVASVQSNNVLLALRLHLQSENSTVRREVFRNLNYTANMSNQLCSSNALCAQRNCDLIPKVFHVRKEVQKELNASEDKVGWTCVQEETVDGICENGLMEKAVLRNKTILREANSEVCGSNQTLNVNLVKVSKVGVKMINAFNDLCVQKTYHSFECKGLVKVATVTARAVIGGKTQDLEFQMEWNVNSDVLSSSQVTITTQTVSLRSAVQTVATDLLNLETENAQAFQALIKQADDKSTHIFNKHLTQLTKSDFQQDSQVQYAKDNGISPATYSFGAYTCKNFPLCKKSNCDNVLKSRSEAYTQQKWFGGAFGIVIPNNGYKCYKVYFHGCWASKTAYRTVNYYDVRSSVCNGNVNPSLTFVKQTSSSYGLTVDVDSVFNQCSIAKNVISCYADAKLKLRGSVYASNSENIDYTSTGRLNFQLSVNGANSVQLVSSSIYYVQKQRTVSSQYSASYFTYGSTLSNSILAAITKTIQNNSVTLLNKIISNVSSRHFLIKAYLSAASADKTIRNSKAILVASDVNCRLNPICESNCDLVKVQEEYLANVNKTVSEANQASHEDKGWKCQNVLNNVTRCMNDIYKQNQTVPETRNVVRNENVCSSNVTPTIELDSLETVETVLANLTESCHTSEGVNNTQKMHCHNLNATSLWSITATAGGNKNSTDLKTIFKMDLDFLIKHKADANGTHRAMFSIDQTESNFGDISTNIESPFVYKISQNEEWYNDMLEVVRDRVRKVVFSSILDNQSIRRGFVTIGQ